MAWHNGDKRLVREAAIVAAWHNEPVSSDWTPLRWPSEWSHPSALELVRNSPVNCILLEKNSPLIPEMRKIGLTTLEASAAPPGISVVKGEWPGIRLDEKSGGASTGP